MDTFTAVFWLALAQIIWINIILSGDNAVVIAMAAKSLPPHLQTKAIVLGSGAAIVLRVILTFLAAALLVLPFVQIVGGLLLLWIGVQLLAGEEEEQEGTKVYKSLTYAIGTILIADLSMSLDNVLAVALAAKINGQVSYLLLFIGLALSIPLVVFGATVIMKIMDRFPFIVIIGAGLIGWVAIDAILHDPVLKHFSIPGIMEYFFKGGGAIFVVGLGKLIALNARKSEEISQASS